MDTTFATKIVPTPSRIVVRMPNWLGDAVMGTPILEDLRKSFKDAYLAVLCHEAISDMLRFNPYIDQCITFSRKNKRSSDEQKKIITSLADANFDTGILLTRSYSSALWFYQAKIPERIGFVDHFRRFLLTRPLPIPKNEETEHQVITYKRLLSPLGIPLSETSPNLNLSEDEVNQAKNILSTYGIARDDIVIGINPGAAYGSAKCWPEEQFIALTKQLLAKLSCHVVYFGDNTSKPLVDTICSQFSERVISLASKTTLRELVSLIHNCNCFITNDSGPMHIAAALKTPLVAIFGSTNDIKTGPYGSEDGVIHKRVACSPCYRRTCPIDFRCMTSIQPEEVFGKVLQKIKT